MKRIFFAALMCLVRINVEAQVVSSDSVGTKPVAVLGIVVEPDGQRKATYAPEMPVAVLDSVRIITADEVDDMMKKYILGDCVLVWYIKKETITLEKLLNKHSLKKSDLAEIFVDGKRLNTNLALEPLFVEDYISRIEKKGDILYITLNKEAGR